MNPLMYMASGPIAILSCGQGESENKCVCERMCVCVRARARACVCACVRACGVCVMCCERDQRITLV